jgi:hypothetical protein
MLAFFADLFFNIEAISETPSVVHKPWKISGAFYPTMVSLKKPQTIHKIEKYSSSRAKLFVLIRFGVVLDKVLES